MKSKIINTSLREITIPCQKEAAFSKSENDFIEKYSLLHEQTYSLKEEEKRLEKQLDELQINLKSLMQEFPLLKARREKLNIINENIKKGDVATKAKYQLTFIQTADLFNIDMDLYNKKVAKYCLLVKDTYDLLIPCQTTNNKTIEMDEDIAGLKMNLSTDKTVKIIDVGDFETDYEEYLEIFDAAIEKFDELWDEWGAYVLVNNAYLEEHNRYFDNLDNEKTAKEEAENNGPMKHPKNVGEHYIELAEKFEQELKNDAVTYKDIDDWNLLIDYYITAGENKIRINQCIEYGLKQHQDDQRLILRTVRQFYDSREFKKAMDILTEIEERGEPLHPSWYALKGLIYDELDKTDEAIAFYKLAIDGCDDSTGGLRAQSYMNLSLAYKKLKRYQEAIDLLKVCKSRRHHSDDLINELCYNYELAGQKEECIPLLEDFLTKNPQFHRCWLTLGNCYSNLQMNEKAIEAYSKMLDTEEGASQAYISLGETYRRMKKFPEAVGFYQKAIASDPMQVIYYICLAFAYDGMEDYANAISAFRDVLKLDPESEFARGWIEILKGKLKPE